MQAITTRSAVDLVADAILVTRLLTSDRPVDSRSYQRNHSRMGCGNNGDGPSVAERWDQLFKMLSCDPRRTLLLRLRDEDPATWVTLPDSAMSPHYDGTRKQMRVALYHTHLPLLERAGYVRWHASPLEARRGPRYGEVEGVLRELVSSSVALPRQLVQGCGILEANSRSSNG